MAPSDKLWSEIASLENEKAGHSKVVAPQETVAVRRR